MSTLPNRSMMTSTQSLLLKSHCQYARALAAIDMQIFMPIFKQIVNERTERAIPDRTIKRN